MNEADLKSIYNAKRQRIDKKSGKVYQGFEYTTYDQFTDWFDLDVYKKGCNYCGLTFEESRALYELRPKCTRGGKRGRRLELDRVDPFTPYDELRNVVWACYWCNNAKSNFFSIDEFYPIAREIGNALRIILKNHYTRELFTS